MPSVSAPSLPRWRITEDSDLSWRFWDGEVVVHHALSNNTFRLSEGAGQLLVRLTESGAQTPQALAQAEEIGVSDLHSTLEELAGLGFVEQC